MPDVRVRMYQVGFGDCFLVFLPGPTRVHKVLVDCGRHAGSRPPAAGEPTFEQVVNRLVEDLRDADGVPRVDVIVVTHRHRDHVHGFTFTDLWRTVHVGEVWLPWLEDPNDPVATGTRTRQEQAAHTTFHALSALRAAARRTDLDDAVDIVYNSTTNAEAFATLHGGFAAPARFRYLPRPARLHDTLDDADFADTAGPGGTDRVLPPGVTVHVLGPSRDPKVIRRVEPPVGKTYLRLLPVGDDTIGPDERPSPDRAVGQVPRPFPTTVAADPDTPDGRERIARWYAGVDVDQVRTIREGPLGDALQAAFSLDGAVNGTSLVLLFEVGPLKLLFPGDAQWGTWDELLSDPVQAAKLVGTNLLKVGHHGSHNATPKAFVERYVTDPTGFALVSVDRTQYGGKWQDIPRKPLLTALAAQGLTVLRSDTPPKRSRDRRVTSVPGYFTEVVVRPGPGAP